MGHEKGVMWRARLDRFASSGLSVERFCSGEGVSVASFYYWRKKLGGDAAVRQRGAGPQGSFQALTVWPASAGVLVHLPGGARIEVRAADLDALRTVIAEVTRSAAGDASLAGVRHNLCGEGGPC